MTMIRKNKYREIQFFSGFNRKASIAKIYPAIINTNIR